MPPYVPRKRTRSPGAQASASRTPRAKVQKTAVFDALDARDAVASSDAKQKFLEHFNGSDQSSNDSSSSEASSHSLPVHPVSSSSTKRRKIEHVAFDEEETPEAADDSSSDSSAEEDGDEDAWDSFVATHGQAGSNEEEGSDKKMDIEINLGTDGDEVATPMEYMNSKKRGPSKRDRQIRNSTHCLHVQCLLYHNHIRNHWLSAKELHRILLKTLTPGCLDEVERWRKSCNKFLGKKSPEKDREGPMPIKPKQRKSQEGANKAKATRDWSRDAGLAEHDATPSLSHGDPILRLLKTLSSFWRKRFTITAPGLRKQGHKSMARIQKEGKAWKSDLHNQDTFGERIESFDRFKELAANAEGSRDIGAQLFTAMLRAVGLEARLVANIQPSGFGWSKGEDADPPREKTDTRANGIGGRPEVQKMGKASAKSVKPIKQDPTPSRRQSNRENKTNPQGTKDLPISLSDDDSPLSSPPSSDTEGSIVDVTHVKKIPTVKRYDRDLPFPIYWTEVLSPLSNTWIPVDPVVLSVVASHSDTHNVFEPRGAGADRAKQVLAYVVAFNPDGSAKDVTTRYLKKHTWPGKTRGVRMPIEKIPILNKHGKVRKHEEYDWFKHVMSLYARSDLKRTAADDVEDAGDLKPITPQRDINKASGEETLQGYKNSADFVLERHLRREEAIKSGCEAVKTFRTGKGDNVKDEPVYRREDVVRCKTIESWHKEGRAVIEGEQPLKLVPRRAVTTIRKREIEQAERESGEKLKQGLYSHEQTDWIIPPPIENGVIPKNGFGNIDVYVPTMVPEGAVHVPLRGTARLCRRLEIDFAEACTGFEFGHRMAVPVLTGVVVAKENKRLLVDAWRADQEIREKKEKEKRDKLVLGMWKKFYAGLRVVERVRREYGEDADKHLDEAVKSELNKQGKGRKGGAQGKKRGKEHEPIPVDDEPMDTEPATVRDDENGGGFIPEGQTVEILDRQPLGGDADEDMAGGFVLEHEEGEDQNARATAPKSMQSLRQRAANEAQPDSPEDELRSGQVRDNDGRQVSAPRRSTASKGRGKGAAKTKTFPQLATKTSPPTSLKAEPSLGMSDGADAGDVRSKYFESGTGDELDDTSSSDDTDENDSDFAGKKIRSTRKSGTGRGRAIRGARTSSRLSRNSKA